MPLPGGYKKRPGATRPVPASQARHASTPPRRQEVPPPPKTCAHKNLSRRSVSNVWASDFLSPPTPLSLCPRRHRGTPGNVHRPSPTRPPSFAPLCFCVGTVGTVGTPHKQGLPAFPLNFEQWEQWEQNPGQRLISAHFRASKPAISPKTRTPNVQRRKNADAPFGAFFDSAARRGFVPRPQPGGPGWPIPGVRD